MSLLLRQAEEIFDTAINGSEDVGIIVGHQGNLHMIDPAGWTLPAMRAEFGAATVFRVECRGNTVRVEGWDGDRSCRLEKVRPLTRMGRLPRLLPPPDYMMRCNAGA